MYQNIYEITIHESSKFTSCMGTKYLCQNVVVIELFSCLFQIFGNYLISRIIRSNNSQERRNP